MAYSTCLKALIPQSKAMINLISLDLAKSIALKEIPYPSLTLSGIYSITERPAADCKNIESRATEQVPSTS